MPPPGDQHTILANPFIETPQRISEYTAQEIATLQSRLEKQLGPEYLSSRSGPNNQKLHYITAEKCIALANEVFGFNGWSSSIRDIHVDFFDDNQQTNRVSVGVSVVVRVTLRDGTYHEDLGFGHVENGRGKAAAYEKAKKEGTTDALKRALRHFGNVLGNCIYDKTYLTKVTRMKVVPTKFDESRLHRHPDYAVKKEPAESKAAKWENSAQPPPQLPTAESFEEYLGELDEADFNMPEDEHPDGVLLPNSNNTGSNQSNGPNRTHQTRPSGNSSMQPPAGPLVRTGSGGNNPPRQPPQTPVQQPARPNANSFPGAQNRVSTGGPRPPQQFNQNRPAPPQPTNGNQNAQTHMTPPQAAGNNTSAAGSETVGFFSARAVNQLPEESLANGTVATAPKPGQSFNPRLESPSIRKTPGIDHTKSMPLARNGQHVPPAKTHSDDADSSNTSTTTTNNNYNNNNAAANRPAGAQPAVVGGGGGDGGAPPRPGAGPGGGPLHARPSNVVNPQLDQTRRIGAPGSASPLANRGQYRPPTMVKRPAGGDGPAPAAAGGGGTGRAPLGDLSSNAAVDGASAGGLAGPEAKRQRIS